MRLTEYAKVAQKRAYAPYSKFKVGSAVLAASGKIYIGCNVENSSYSVTICAERVALSSAVAAGEKKFKTIFVIGSSSHIAYPCGTCRQFISEIAPNAEIICSDKTGKKTQKFKVKDLLPRAFSKASLGS